VTDPLSRLSAALADRYRIERELGQGGMATVYLAEDLKHDRKVALKVLKPELAAVIGAERFVVEIKTTAALQHPHILPLFDSGETDSFLYYVMPFIDGETLRSKLDRETQLGIDEAVGTTVAIADALDYAHRHGVIHRDIKPENILLHDGRPMVADFGIALALSAAAGGRMTETGMSLGTPHYMSPEQATAEKLITARSDIYSLGSVLYEMLTGNPPHVGASAQQIIMKIVTEEAAPVTKLRKAVPRNVADAVARSLEKLPADRFATAKEFADALKDAHFTTTSALPAGTTVGPPDGRRWKRLAGALGAALAFVAVVATYALSRPASPGIVRRFYITMSQYLADYGNPVISPDGTRIVYLNLEGGLMVRNSDDLTAKPIPGSDNAWGVTFSPDSRSIAFNTGFPGAIKVITLESGTVQTLVADSTFGYGMAWSDDGWLYYLQGEAYGRDLMRVPARGGTPEFVARPDSAANQLFFYWPQVLPGHRKMLLTLVPYLGEASIGVLDLATRKLTVVARGTLARYTQTGHLVVVQDNGDLRAARFDASSGSLQGDFTTLAENLSMFTLQSGSMSLSNEGTLVYQPSPPPGQVVRVSRNGVEQILDPKWKDVFQNLALSPEGNRLAVGVVRGGRSELWVKNLRTGSLTRISAGGTQNYRPSWPPSGRDVMFTSDQQGGITAYHVPADGSAPPTQLLPAVNMSIDEAEWPNDGTWIIFRGGSGGGRDIYAIRPGIDSVERAIINSPAEEFSPALSPDGRWLAYASDETGRTEVYVRPFPNTGLARHTISHNGGTEPRWSHSGRELFFRDGAHNFVAAEVATGDVFRVNTERALFSVRNYTSDNRNHSYAIAPDDQSFIFIAPTDASFPTSQVIITLNWFRELKEKVK
jgi:serine/threonine protein kinase